MIFSRRIRVSLLLLLLVLISGGVGFFLGIIVSKVVAKKKDDPAVWHETALKDLEKLQPTDAQRERFRDIVGRAVDELTVVRNSTLETVVSTFNRAVDNIEKELTPAQKEKFAKMKPTKDRLTLELLKKTRQSREKGDGGQTGATSSSAPGPPPAAR